MQESDGWEIGQNWVSVGLMAVSVIAALFFYQERKFDQLEMERDSLIAEMTPEQIRKVYSDLDDYYDAKSRNGAYD
ncbi:hypothetical protein [Alteromonas mediterranea]|jgi:hypothetical protein|uniref:Uncharacterized protein n=1 Tax=Alteromonas mediterranea TaxID=314275 RepID=A0AAC8XJ78_9ALTE|nr:hypothetical protein [Alteromonas mediterranea]AFV85236.1 hypothetical protein amad1_08625 [Alteromonas mediterranea DE1]AGP97247.1 hypothetical protein I635_08615 [Alteromonas mediterranea UM7]AMJ78332.1 hypothetical protein AV942_08530 [Alteromonas mediterranea]AMJ82481.1 hypothetical protein AV941_08565 [Alteromonas mediterranea]|tara:strand:- start:227 stop:454 length:228 start_codon:yes stop_codon:yes gene_type:complete